MSAGWTYGQQPDSRAVRSMLDELMSEGRGAITRGTRDRAKAMRAALLEGEERRTTEALLAVAGVKAVVPFDELKRRVLDNLADDPHRPFRER